MHRNEADLPRNKVKSFLIVWGTHTYHRVRLAKSQVHGKGFPVTFTPWFQYFFLTVWDPLNYINLSMFVSFAGGTMRTGDYGSLFLHCGKTYLDSNVPSPISFSSILSNVSSVLSPDSPDKFLFPMQSSTRSMRIQKQKAVRCVIFYNVFPPPCFHNFVVFTWPEIKLHNMLVGELYIRC